MELAKSCRYAVQGLLHLASREDLAQPVVLRDIAAAIDAPVAFLSKIFQSMRSSAIVRSHRGQNRGYTLVRSPDQISLYDVIVAVEGPGCLHTTEVTAQEGGPAFAGVWREVEELMAKRLRAISISSLLSVQSQGEE